MTFSALDSTLVGPLFATDAMRAVFADEARLAAMLRAEAVLARVEARFGLAAPDLAGAIEGVRPADLDPPAIGRATAVSGVPTIPFVKALERVLPADLARDLHKGATTQDVLDTALMLQVRDGLDLVAVDLAAILDGLAGLAETHRTTPCVGRTYGQHAAPVTFGFKAALWLAGIAEAAEEWPALRRALASSLAGPVGTLAALREHGPGVADAYAAELGLAAAPIAWHVRRGAPAALGCWLARLVGALAKMAIDVANLASTEVGEVAEPYVPGRGGSSAMPHKRNPVGATVILAAHAAAPGLAATLLAAMAALHERPPGLWHAEWHALPSLFGLASGALREARGLAEGLSVDAARMRANLDLTRGLLFADAAAARLGRHLGRGAAHDLVEHAATRVRETGRSLREVLTADPALAGRPEVVAELDGAFDLAPAIAAAARFADRARAAARPVADSLRTPPPRE